MKTRIWVNSVAASALVLSFLLVGCDRQISKTKSSRVSSDGTVKTNEKTVTEAPNGTVTKSQESTTTSPNN